MWVLHLKHAELKEHVASMNAMKGKNNIAWELMHAHSIDEMEKKNKLLTTDEPRVPSMKWIERVHEAWGLLAITSLIGSASSKDPINYVSKIRALRRGGTHYL